MTKALTVFTILCFCFAPASSAAPCYGTKMPLKKGFFAGTQIYSVFKRNLEGDYGKLRSRQEFLLVSYGVFDWLAIDLEGGAGNIKQHSLRTDEVDYPSSFAGGYGFRLKLCDERDVKVVFGFQHISVHPHRVYLGQTKNTAVLDDWQFSLLASRDFFKATPYIGTRWSRIDYIHWIEEDRKRNMSDLTKAVGFILGLDLPVTEKTWINLEGQLFDAEAVVFSVNYKF